MQIWAASRSGRWWFARLVGFFGATYTAAQLLGMPSSIVTWGRCVRGGPACDAFVQAMDDLLSLSFLVPFDPWRLVNVVMLLMFMAFLFPARIWRRVMPRQLRPGLIPPSSPAEDATALNKNMIEIGRDVKAGGHVIAERNISDGSASVLRVGRDVAGEVSAKGNIIERGSRPSGREVDSPAMQVDAPSVVFRNFRINNRTGASAFGGKNLENVSIENCENVSGGDLVTASTDAQNISVVRSRVSGRNSETFLSLKFQIIPMSQGESVFAISILNPPGMNQTAHEVSLEGDFFNHDTGELIFHFSPELRRAPEGHNVPSSDRTLIYRHPDLEPSQYPLECAVVRLYREGSVHPWVGRGRNALPIPGLYRVDVITAVQISGDPAAGSCHLLKYWTRSASGRDQVAGFCCPN